jgi:hypothetical protein
VLLELIEWLDELLDPDDVLVVDSELVLLLDSDDVLLLDAEDADSELDDVLLLDDSSSSCRPST